MAHDRLEPWGPERIDLAFARLMAMYAQVHAKEGAPQIRATDFMPDFLSDRTVKKPTLTMEEQDAEFQRLGEEIGVVMGDDDKDEEDFGEGSQDEETYIEDE